MLELMSRFLIHAPHGLFFTIPANQAMYYAPADPANVSEQLRSMATSSYLPIISARRRSPDIVLSRDIFYYSPEGTYETITQGANPNLQEIFTNPHIDAETRRTCIEQYLSPSPAFRQRFALP